MRLKKLKLENFRGFENLELDFHPEVTVFVGINGSGKTSILDAVASLSATALRSSPGTQPVQATDCQIGKLTATVALEGTNSSNEFVVSCQIDTGTVRFIQPPSQGKLSQEQLAKGPLPILCYFQVNRHAVDSTPGSTNSRMWYAQDAWKQAFDMKASFEAFFHWFREREDLKNEVRIDEPQYVDPQLDAVREALETILPGYTEPRVRRPRIGGSKKKEFVATKPVLVIKKNGTEFPFDQFSEGERTMAALVFDIARRLAIANPGSPEPLHGDGVVLIDEIDLHLHPQWQEKAIPALRRTFPNIQFVVTTHSPIVLGYVPKECVRLLHNFELMESPPTEGRDPNSIYLEVFDQQLRSEPYEKKIHEIAVLIDDEKLDEAQERLDELAAEWGPNEREVVRLSTLIAMLRDD